MDNIDDFRISLDDLEKILNILRTLFDVLCFNEHYRLWLSNHSDRNRQNQATDIDLMLDLVVQNSNLLHWPENHPEHWINERREKLTSEELDILNQYRRKFQLPEV